MNLGFDNNNLSLSLTLSVRRSERKDLHAPTGYITPGKECVENPPALCPARHEVNLPTSTWSKSIRLKPAWQEGKLKVWETAERSLSYVTSVTQGGTFLIMHCCLKVQYKSKFEWKGNLSFPSQEIHPTPHTLLTKS